MQPACDTDFDDWLVQTFQEVGPFTMLMILVDVGQTTVELQASSYIHVIGDEIRWGDMEAMLAGSGAAWNAIALFRADRKGPVDDSTAQWRLASLARHLRKDRSIIRHSEFFNHQGLRLQIEQQPS
jgi:hypothetical protein